MKCTHEIAGTHEGNLLPEHAPGAKSLVCIGLFRHVRTQKLRDTGNQPSGDRKGRPFLIERVKFFTTLHSPLKMSKKCVKL